MCSCSSGLRLGSDSKSCNGMLSHYYILSDAINPFPSDIHQIMYPYLCVSSPSDVNECAEGSSGCEQSCTNTEGSFQCECNAGYMLAGNGLSCIGTFS